MVYNVTIFEQNTLLQENVLNGRSFSFSFTLGLLLPLAVSMSDFSCGRFLHVLFLIHFIFKFYER